MTKEEVNRVIDYFQNDKGMVRNCVQCGDIIPCDCGANVVKVLPVLIGDVLAKIEEELKKTEIVYEKGVHGGRKIRVMDLWSECGITSSLQEIVEKAGWEEKEVVCDELNCQGGNMPLGEGEDGDVVWGACPKCKPCDGGIPGKLLIETLKSPALELFQFLATLTK